MRSLLDEGQLLIQQDQCPCEKGAFSADRHTGRTSWEEDRGQSGAPTSYGEPRIASTPAAQRGQAQNLQKEPCLPTPVLRLSAPRILLFSATQLEVLCYSSPWTLTQPSVCHHQWGPGAKLPRGSSTDGLGPSILLLVEAGGVGRPVSALGLEHSSVSEQRPHPDPAGSIVAGVHGCPIQYQQFPGAD